MNILKRLRLTPRLVTAAFIVTACAVPASVWFVTWNDTRLALAAEKTLWTIEGPPCAVADKPPAYVARMRRPPKTLIYNGTTFTRLAAMAYCAQLPDNPAWPTRSYDVCQFNNPGVVTVRIGEKTTIFVPPPGGRATVTVDRGKATCVVGGWLKS